MKLILLNGGIQTFVNTFESEFMENHSQDVICKDDLTEREKVLAQGLVRKGVFERKIRSGKTYYTTNQI